METLKAIADLLGNVSMLFIAMSMCVWGPLLLRAIHKSELRNLKSWERHFEFELKKSEFEVRKAKAFMARVHPTEEMAPEDVN